MEEKPINKVLRVANEMDELLNVQVFLEELGEEWGLNMSLVFSLNLVLEEALTNIISYSYDDESRHSIEIGFAKNGDQLSISIVDDGREYDPTLKPDPDITLSAEDRQIGGLGIYLMKNIMDKIEYKRTENKNCLILTKKIES